MKLKNTAGTLLLITVLGIFLGGVLGCASSHQNMRTQNEFQNPVGEQSADSRGSDARFVTREREILPEKPLEMRPEELERLGDLSLERDNLYMAFIEYEKSLKLNPDNIRVRYKKGLVLILGGLEKEAITEFNKILEKDAGYALAYQGLGQAFLQAKTYDAAEKNLQKAIELNPKLWRSHDFLGLVYDRQRRHDEAMHAYAAAIRLKPHYGLLYHNLGVSYSLAGDYERAIGAFQKALENRYVDKKVFNNLGLALAKTGRYQEALEAFKKGGDIAHAYNNLGCAYLEQGKLKDAVRCFEKAIALSPTFYANANENLKKARLAALN